MRQRLFKAISCVALLVSVFFCTSITALADDSLSGGMVVIDSTSQEIDAVALDEYEYTGSSSIHTQISYGQFIWSPYVGNALGAYNGISTFDVDVPVLFRLGVERGHTYSGQVYFYLDVNLPSLDHPSEGLDYRYRRVGLGGFAQQSFYDGVTVSYYGFVGAGVDFDSGVLDVVVCVTFDNFQPTFTGDLNVNSMFNISGSVQCLSSVAEGKTALPGMNCTCSVSSDWYGNLYDYPTDAIVDSDGTLIKNQTIQQQQIANQQSQQSQQQHNSLINGYDNAANDSMLADKNSVLKGFEQQQDQAMSDGQQYVANFSANYDTAPLQAMAPAFMMISTWFNDLWGGMGNFSTVLIVGLMLCVAGYILKLKH